MVYGAEGRLALTCRVSIGYGAIQATGSRRHRSHAIRVSHPPVTLNSAIAPGAARGDTPNAAPPGPVQPVGGGRAREGQAAYTLLVSE